MTDSTGALPPAGWYPDPYGAPYERWWDGAQWTTHTTEATAAPVQAAAPAQPVVLGTPVTPVEAEPVEAEPVEAEPVEAEPVAAEPVAAEPVESEPVAAEPAVADPFFVDARFDEPVIPPADAVEPAVVEPVVVEPTVVEPEVFEPAVAEPAVTAPPAAEPSFVDSRFAEPVFAEPAHVTPAVAEPWFAEHVSAEPVSAEPAVAEPVSAEPVSAEPAVAQPVVAEPVSAEADAVRSAFEQPAYQQPAFEQPDFSAPLESPAFAAPSYKAPAADSPRSQASIFEAPAMTPTAEPVAATPTHDAAAFESLFPAAAAPAVFGANVESPANVAPVATDDAFDFGQLVSGGAGAGAAAGAGAGVEDSTDAFGSWAGEEYVEPPRNSAATAGLALGILSFFLSALAGIPGIIASLRGMSTAGRLKASGVEKTGRTKAFAGFLLSVVGTLVTAAIVVYLFFPSLLGLAPPAASPDISTGGTGNVPDDSLTQNGNIAGIVGTSAAINASGTSTPAVTFTVSAIQPDFTCTSPTAIAPVNGEFVAVTMEITTAADYESTMVSGGPMHMTSSDWASYTADSGDPIANGDAGASCIGADQQLPADFPAGKTFTGIVVLDIDPQSTSFSWSPADVKDLDPTQTRWEWALIAS